MTEPLPMTDKAHADKAMEASEIADELRKWWSFNDGQRHTHTWHDREDFIAKKLPALLEERESVFVRALTEMAERSSAAMENASNIIATLEGERERMRADLELDAALEESAATIIRNLRAALEPFAKKAGWVPKAWPNARFVFDLDFTAGDLRKARRALEGNGNGR